MVIVIETFVLHGRFCDGSAESTARENATDPTCSVNQISSGARYRSEKSFRDIRWDVDRIKSRVERALSL